MGGSGAGSGDVVVTADTGAVATLEGGFVYYTKGEVNDVSPSSGQYGSIVTISGVALRARGTEVVEVTLGGVLASIISEDNDQVVVQAGSGPNFRELGAVVLTSDTGAKVVTGDEEWTYLRPSKIESVSPPSGRANSRITIWLRPLRWRRRDCERHACWRASHAHRRQQVRHHHGC